MGIVFTSSWDDGHMLDERVGDLLVKHDLSGTFFVPVSNCEGLAVMPAAVCRDLAAQFEVGSHTLDHCYLNRLEPDAIRRQIVEGKQALEDLLGEPVSGFCYPGGKHNPTARQAILDAGFDYARGIGNLYLENGQDRFLMPTTIQFYPHTPDVYVRNFLAKGHWSQRVTGLCIALAHADLATRLRLLFDRAVEEGGVFHLWGHSWELDHIDGGWEMLDSFLAHVRSQIKPEDALTNKAVAERFYRH